MNCQAPLKLANKPPEDAIFINPPEVAASESGSSSDSESEAPSPEKPPFQRAPGPALGNELEPSAAPRIVSAPIPEAAAAASDLEMSSMQSLFALPDVCGDCRSHFLGLQAQAVT
jgi:hypothetical protein